MSDDTIDRGKLPIRRPPFQGVVNRTLDGSQPDWDSVAPIPAPEGAPNVLIVLIDDAGFGNPSAFGGPVSTPTLERLAGEGLKYNRHHVTAMCSPTRAALLTGRNNHAVGFGMVGEFAGPFPGYSAMLPRDCAPLPKILQGNGYSTACFGKWHLTPDNQQGPAGPFDRWPNGWGFDYFWGFLGGDSGQFDPVITENGKAIGVPEADDFYLPNAMTDKTIEWLHGVRVPRARASRGSPTSRPDAATPRITSGRSGPRSTRARSIRAGTSCARRPSSGRSGSGWFPPTRS